MPYSVDDQDNLPDHVKKMSAKKRRQWIHTFNSAMEQHNDESKAFAMANGVVKKSVVPSIFDVDIRQVPMEVAEYEPYGATDGKGCASCQWYISPDSCILVAGDISPTGKSKFFTTKVEFEFPDMPMIHGGEMMKQSWLERAKEFAASLVNRDGDKPFTLVKTKEGRLRFFAVVSNNFEDVDGEILSEAAHKEFVDWCTKEEKYPELWLWHTPGTKFGEGDFVDYVDGFVIGSGLVDEGKEPVALAVEKQEVGVSHGFFGIESKQFKGYERYRSFEWSPLPLQYAANKSTAFNVLMKGFDMAFSDDKRAFLEKAGVPTDTITRLETLAQVKGEELKAAGVVSKEANDTGEAVVEQKAAETQQQTIESLATMISTLADSVKSLQDTVGTVVAENKELKDAVKKTADDILAEALTSPASRSKEVTGIGEPSRVHRPSESSDNVVVDNKQQGPKAPTSWFDAEFDKTILPSLPNGVSTDA